MDLTYIDKITDQAFLNVQEDLMKGRIRILSHQENCLSRTQQISKIQSSKIYLYDQISRLSDQEQALSKIITKAKKQINSRLPSYSLQNLYDESEQNLNVQNYVKKLRAERSQRQITRQFKIKEQENYMVKQQEEFQQHEIQRIESGRLQRQYKSQLNMLKIQDNQAKRQQGSLLQNNEIKRILGLQKLKLDLSQQLELDQQQKVEQERQKSLDTIREQNEKINNYDLKGHQDMYAKITQQRVNLRQARNVPNKEFERKYLEKINQSMRTKTYNNVSQQEMQNQSGEIDNLSVKKIHKQYAKWIADNFKPQISQEKQEESQIKIQYILNFIERKQTVMIKKAQNNQKQSYTLTYDNLGNAIIEQDKLQLTVVQLAEINAQQIGNKYLAVMKNKRASNKISTGISTITTGSRVDTRSLPSEQSIVPQSIKAINYLKEIRESRRSVTSQQFIPSTLEGYIQHAQKMEIKAQRTMSLEKRSSKGDQYLVEAIKAKLQALKFRE